MIGILISYLTQKFQTFNYLQTVYGLAGFEDGDNKYLWVYQNNEKVLLNLDTHQSCSLFLTNGKVDTTQEESQLVANEYNVTKKYPFKALIYIQGNENVNCSTESQRIADSIQRSITGRQKQILASTQLTDAYIEVTATDFDKDAIYQRYYSSGGLQEKDILIEIEFDFVISGNQDCFVDSPCDDGDYIFSFDAPKTLCEKINECLDIPTEDGQYVLDITNGVKSWQDFSATGLVDGNGTTINGNKVDLGGTLSQDTTVDADSNLLEFTTAYGHNLIFTDDFLGQGWNFTGFYHNDAGIVYLNGIIDIFGTERSTVAVIDNVNGTNSYAQVDTQLVSIGYVPNMADITRVNAIQSSAQHNTINSSDNDSTKINVEFSHSNGDGTSTPVASVYRDGAVATDSGFYIGDKTTDGSWRFVTSGANLVIQKREAGSWVTKQTLI